MPDIFSFLFQNRFRKEMVFIILLKLVALFLIWEICFSGTSEVLTPKKIAAHYDSTFSTKKDS